MSDAVEVEVEVRLVPNTATRDDLKLLDLRYQMR
jgi:hypothetical protein